jgi:hypothetical protein
MNSEADGNSPSGAADLAVYDTASMPDEATTTEVYTYKWFTLLGFKGEDLLIFTNNCNAKYSDVFEFATVTPANINPYNKTAQTFFANIAVKQIGETSFEQSDFPVGHSTITAVPKFAGLVRGCEQTRMSFKHNGLGSNRGHVVGYVAPDKCPGIRANEFTFDLYTKLVSEAIPEIISKGKDGGKGKGSSNNADSFNNPGGKKRSASKTLREEQNISESADKPRKDKAERKRHCNPRYNHPQPLFCIRLSSCMFRHPKRWCHSQFFSP